jgi:hypothetical protein
VTGCFDPSAIRCLSVSAASGVGTAALVQCRPYGPDLRMKPAPSYATSDLWLPTPPIGGRHAGQGSPSTRPSEHTISSATCRSDRFVSLDDALRAVASAPTGPAATPPTRRRSDITHRCTWLRRDRPHLPSENLISAKLRTAGQDWSRRLCTPVSRPARPQARSSGS